MRADRVARTLAFVAATCCTLAGCATQPDRGSGEGVPATPRMTPGRSDVQELILSQPLAFQPNLGQTAAGIRFLAHAPGATLALGARRGALVLARPRHGGDSERSVLAFTFAGARRSPQLAGVRRLPGDVNYFSGTKTHWRTGVGRYAGVSYRGLWTGIDAEFHGSRGRLEYDFRIAPGATPRRIGLRFPGVSSARIQRSGALALALPGGGVVRELPPVAYQAIGGRRHAVSSRFAVSRSGVVRFTVGAYDRSRTLVIDPQLVYSTYLGDGGNDQANSVAVDASGHIYVAGTTDAGAATPFPTSAGTYQAANAGHTDAFVAELDPSATGAAQLVYSSYLGGAGDDQAFRLALGPGGRIAVTGRTDSAGATPFPTSAGAYQSANAGGRDAFVAVLDPSAAGTAQLVYSSYLGGGGDDLATGLAIDAGGHVFVAGQTGSTAFPTTAGAYQTATAAPSGGDSAFVSELDPSASGTAQLAYSTYLGNDTETYATQLAIARGGIYVVGQTNAGGATPFPTSSGALQATAAGGIDAFAAKLDPSATGAAQLAYSTYFGGGGNDIPTGLAVDASGHLFLAGSTSSTGPTPLPTTTGAFQTTNNGGATGSDAFVTELDPSATGTAQLVYSTYLGGGGDDYGGAVAPTADGQIYVVGPTQSAGATPFPTSSDAYQGADAGSTDAFVTRLDPSASGAGQLSYSSYLGGSRDDVPLALALDPSGDLYVDVVGATLLKAVASPFPTSPGAYQATSPGGNQAAFVTKLYAGPPPHNTAGPVITGGAAFDTQSSCDPGTWTGTPAFTYSWQVDGTPNGATERQYAPVAADVGHELSCRVTATNPAGQATADSTALTVAETRPVNLTAPSIRGTAAVGDTLSCDPGTWSNVPDLAERWLRDGAVITDATGATYDVADADAGHQLVCRVTATNGHGTTHVDSAAVAIADGGGPRPPTTGTPGVTTTYLPARRSAAIRMRPAGQATPRSRSSGSAMACRSTGRSR